MFAQVTFDLNGADSSDYDCVIDALEEIGIRGTVNWNGIPLELPHNTYFGELPDDVLSPEDASELIYRIVKRAFDLCDVSGKTFVIVGESAFCRIG